MAAAVILALRRRADQLEELHKLSPAGDLWRIALAGELRAIANEIERVSNGL